MGTNICWAEAQTISFPINDKPFLTSSLIINNVISRSVFFSTIFDEKNGDKDTVNSGSKQDMYLNNSEVVASKSVRYISCIVKVFILIHNLSTHLDNNLSLH